MLLPTERCFRHLLWEMVTRLSKAIFMGRLVFHKDMCLQSMKLTFLHRGK